VVATRRARWRADARVVHDLPDLVDLFRVAAGGGLTVHQAVQAVGAVARESHARVLREVQRRVSLGERLGDALSVLLTIGEPVRPLVSALQSAERQGTALVGPLQHAGDRARELRRRQAEEAARRVPVRLLFPLVLCVLPAFVLLAVVPLLAGTLRSFSL
jgi:pilus assembly protein TadC